MLTELQVIGRIKDWAAATDAVRAVILTSSRAIDGAPTDAYSDYDVILVLDDVTAYAERSGWLSAWWRPSGSSTTTCGTSTCRGCWTGLFGVIAREVGESLGYGYPDTLEQRVTQHVRRMREAVFGNGPVDDDTSSFGDIVES